MCRVAKKILASKKNYKVILCVNELATISMLAKCLESYNPVVLQGSVTKAETRAAIVDSFNTDKKVRVMVMTIRTGGMGINLHDTVGDAPRYMLISPSYYFQDIAQATGRIFRTGQRSDAKARIFYGDGYEEAKIRTALILKAKNTRETVDPKSAVELVLPDQYEDEKEPSSY